MPTVRVALGTRSYAVHVARGVLGQLETVLAPLRGRRFAVVSNPRVWALHGRRLAGLRRLGTVERILIPDGERFKTTRTWARIGDALLRAGLGRDTVVVALGGGVVGDVAGFAAATFMRGVDLIQLPTSLLAMVDSSVGGKVAVNHPAGKNLLGAFHQPRAVLADTALLATLAQRELQSGTYEMLKCGVLGDRALFARMERYGSLLRAWPAAELERAVTAAVRLKARVVAADEREGGLRRVLNLGHTLGHAFEAVTRYRRFTHGEAIGWGLIAAARLAAQRGLLAQRDQARIVDAVERLGPRPPVLDLETAALLEAVQHDKKARAGRVPFILPTAIGRVTIVDDVTEREIRAVLRGLRAGG